LCIGHRAQEFRCAKSQTSEGEVCASLREESVVKADGERRTPRASVPGPQAECRAGVSEIWNLKSAFPAFLNLTPNVALVCLKFGI
jgi:hypothetical protein